MNPSSKTQTDRFAAQRQEMVKTQLRQRGVRDERVLAVMESVPRHEFVLVDDHQNAYADSPLPIGEGQTVSQPLIVAIMLEALALQGSEIVLEVGTGSGYQTALLARLVQQVYSIERFPVLAQSASERLQRLGHNNVALFTGDGSLGLPEKAPFDCIIVSAAAPRIPQPLLEQLRPQGRMVIPVGPAYSQQLQLVQMRDGQAVIKSIEGCRFVPLIGSQGYDRGW